MAAANPEELSLAGSRKTELLGFSHGLSGSPHRGTQTTGVLVFAGVADSSAIPLANAASVRPYVTPKTSHWRIRSRKYAAALRPNMTTAWSQDGSPLISSPVGMI